MTWTDEQLAQLPVSAGFRLRGLEMTRLETFCDAAFAFAVTLLVIAGDGIPRSYADLLTALKGVPAFAASFAAIASFWWAHRLWSRRFGLEDGVTTLISLVMVMVMLVYVYPLKMVFSAFASYASGGRLPTEFVLTDPRDMLGLFVVYGVGFAAQTGMLALLHVRGLKAGGRPGPRRGRAPAHPAGDRHEPGACGHRSGVGDLGRRDAAAGRGLRRFPVHDPAGDDAGAGDRLLAAGRRVVGRAGGDLILLTAFMLDQPTSGTTGRGRGPTPIENLYQLLS